MALTKLEIFNNSIKERHKSFDAVIPASKEMLVEFLRNNLDSLSTQYTIAALFKTNLTMKRALFVYANDYKKISHRVYSLIYNHACSECGENTTFDEDKKQFKPVCGKHKTLISATNKKINSVNVAMGLFEKFNVRVMNYPDGINGEQFILKCGKCEHTFSLWLKNGRMQTLTDRICPKCFPRSISSFEYEIITWLGQHNIEAISQHPISKYKNGVKSIDIFLPEYNIGIEYDGVMFHSFGKSKYSMFNNADSEDSDIHLNKTNICKSLNIDLLHIFSDEWDTKKDLWKSVILNKCGKSLRIAARKCAVVDITNEEYRKFVNTNHLQGDCNSSVKIGLIYAGELVSVMSLSKSRFNKQFDYELIRFCNKIGVSVVGGFSKLLMFFRRKYPRASIISYANKRWSNGRMYHKNGFELINESKPNYFYFHESKKILESRMKYQKHKLVNCLRSERDHMFDNGYRRIWDCGNYVYGMTPLLIAES